MAEQAAVYDSVKYQVFSEKKQKELYMSIYPICVDECEATNPSKSDQLVWAEKTLQCSQNCLQKYKSSMNLALKIVQVVNEQ